MDFSYTLVRSQYSWITTWRIVKDSHSAQTVNIFAAADPWPSVECLALGGGEEAQAVARASALWETGGQPVDL